jgi:hypothetical protein
MTNLTPGVKTRSVLRGRTSHTPPPYGFVPVKNGHVKIRWWMFVPILLLSVYQAAYYGLDHGSDDLSTFDHSIVRGNTSGLGSVALIFVAHDREDYFRESIGSVFRARGLENLDIIVSMDYPPNFESLQAVVDEYSTPAHPIRVWKNVLPFGQYLHTADDRITFHHGQILHRAFDLAGYDYAIIMETDLTISPDFFEYMFDAAPLLAVPSSNLMCVSGWNDNGMQWFTLNETRAFRTDFYPGLGWMLHRSMWTDRLSFEWPMTIGHTSYDVWLRTKSSTRTMDCIVPETPRTHHISQHGTNVNGASSTWYAAMRLASGRVRIPKSELESVGELERYERRVRDERILPARLIASSDPIPKNSSVMIIVNDDRCMMDGFLEKIIYGGETGMVENDVRRVNEKLRLFYYQFRSAHNGMMTVTLAENPHGRTNVTLIAERSRHHWIPHLNK